MIGLGVLAAGVEICCLMSGFGEDLGTGIKSGLGVFLGCWCGELVRLSFTEPRGSNSLITEPLSLSGKGPGSSRSCVTWVSSSLTGVGKRRDGEMVSEKVPDLDSSDGFADAGGGNGLVLI